MTAVIADEETAGAVGTDSKCVFELAADTKEEEPESGQFRFDE
jgi:hypothetical protein